VSSYSGNANRDNREMLAGLYISSARDGDMVTGGSMIFALSVVDAAGWGRSRKRSKMQIGRRRFVLVSSFLEEGGSWGL